MEMLIANYEFVIAAETEEVPMLPGIYALFYKEKHDYDLIDLRASENLALMLERFDINLKGHMVAYLVCENDSLREEILNNIRADLNDQERDQIGSGRASRYYDSDTDCGPTRTMFDEEISRLVDEAEYAA